MSEAPGGIGAVSSAGEKVVLARSDHTLRLVNALDHARQALRAPPSGDFSATMDEKLTQKPADQVEAADAASASASDDMPAPRLDFMRTSILRGHLSQPGTFNPDPNAAPLPELPRERDAAQDPAPDIMRADEIAALSAMLDADRSTTALPSLEALAGAEANHLPPDVLQDLHNRHRAREAQGNAINGWPAPGPPEGMNGTGNAR